MAGDPFTSAIFRWLNSVAANALLPPAAFKLAYVINQHINRVSHEAWPFQETLKEALGLKDERQIRRLTVALERGGHLITRRRKQSLMVYRLAQDRTEMSSQTIKTGLSSARPDIFSHQDRTEMSAKPLNEPESESARATRIPEDFSLDDQTYTWALGLLGSNASVERSIRRFRDHKMQVAGNHGLSRDWQAKARLWIDDDFNRRRPARLSQRPRRHQTAPLTHGQRSYTARARGR